ncbi:hypothetical protein PYCC9005_000096 [Savitreella phatthalungensis]
MARSFTHRLQRHLLNEADDGCEVRGSVGSDDEELGRSLGVQELELACAWIARHKPMPAYTVRSVIPSSAELALQISSPERMQLR